MFTKEEMEEGAYTEEDVQIIQEVKERLIIDPNNIEQSEKDVKRLMSFFKNVFLSELETYPGSIDRKSFIVTTPEDFNFKGSFIIPLLGARIFLRMLNLQGN